MGLFAARRLPADLQLTAAQRTQITVLMASFRAAHQSDLSAMREAMRAMMQRMRAARTAGQPLTVEERRALFQQSAPARQRLTAAQRELGAQIQNVLTRDQKAWLASHRPTPCSSSTACHARFARRAPGGQMRNPS
jgi:Spy/CpxP family protein refolding chaperone